MDEKQLPEIPALTRTYRKALASSARAVMAAPPTTLPRVRYRVADVAIDAAQVHAYQRLLGEPVNDDLPAGALHVVGFPLAVALMARADFPLPVLGMVHLRNEIEQFDPIRVQDRLTIQAWAQNLTPHRRGTQVELVVQIRRRGSQDIAWQGTSTYLARRQLPRLGPPLGRRPEPAAVPAQTGQWQLSANIGRRYAEVSGDRNPIHLSRFGAKLFGFRRPIAHGMYTAARALATIGAARGDAFRWTANFYQPVPLPSTLRVGVELDQGYRYAGWQAHSELTCLTGTVSRL
ncbi:MAG: MaoC/PaaZ C-terminal domain-containing protein [Beutenbergiaceae bacterium]